MDPGIRIGKTTEHLNMLYGIEVEVGGTEQIVWEPHVIRLALTPEAKQMADVLVSALKKTQLKVEGPTSMYSPEFDLGSRPPTEAPVRIMVGIKPR